MLIFKRINFRICEWSYCTISSARRAKENCLIKTKNKMLIDIVRISLCQLINLTGCKNIAKQEKAIKRGLNYRAP